MALKASSWRCPKCGRSFADRNQWHSCGTFRVADRLEGVSPRVLELYTARSSGWFGDVGP